MARILQIRRGTTAQNDNFTGLPGEVSFDTTAKTLRVHDGEKLGGYELARADQLGDGAPESSANGGNFDINAVPSEFWENIIAMYSSIPLQSVSSNPSMIANVSYLEHIFTVNQTPKFAQALLICQTPEAGYSIGDIVASFGIGTRANPLPNAFKDTDGVHVRLLVASENFWVSHKTTGITTNITNDKWRAQFVLWY